MQYPRDKLILYTWEPPMHDPCGNQPAYQVLFKKVFSLCSLYVDEQHVMQHFYVQPSLERINNIIKFDHKKLCTMIVSYKFGGSGNSQGSLYHERLKAIDFFEQFDNNIFEFYGMGWPLRKSYKGKIPHKKDYLKNYKFCICYENTNIYKGYITEKIFDCFIAGCVPIYWGAPDIENYIPKECFIDKRDFKTFKELYHFLRNMDEKTYQKYLNAVEMFLTSPKAYRYSIDYFIDRFFTAIDPHYNRALIFSPSQQQALMLANRSQG